jgi:spore coat protein JB
MIEQTNLIQRIYELGFAIDDITLYLDIHPNDMRALNYYHEIHENYKRFWKEYNENYAPLTDRTVTNKTSWNWNKERMPWEGGC